MIGIFRIPQQGAEAVRPASVAAGVLRTGLLLRFEDAVEVERPDVDDGVEDAWHTPDHVDRLQRTQELQEGAEKVSGRMRSSRPSTSVCGRSCGRCPLTSVTPCSLTLSPLWSNFKPPGKAAGGGFVVLAEWAKVLRRCFPEEGPNP
ncbi:hypothetical protein [Streptosporangium sp. NPDC049376]|uniref:hypothetical protein n=1 Tax=Streptosporangium sp. NPDC049376 TaxID=3366192 RepID=UPI00379BBB10